MNRRRTDGPRVMEFFWAGAACLLLAAHLGGCQVLMAEEAFEPSAICSTDEDCLKHCPPPADDPDCDGGPQ